MRIVRHLNTDCGIKGFFSYNYQNNIGLIHLVDSNEMAHAISVTTSVTDCGKF